MPSRKLASLAGLALAWLALAAASAPPVTPAPPVVPPLFTTVAACANPKLQQMQPARFRAPKATLRLVSAGDETTRELGLMCVTRIRPQAGMIFIFDRDGRWEFWMKNTLIPLDMIWVHSDGTVDAVAARVPASTRTTPDDEVARRSGNGRYVIELASGEAARDGIVPGACLASLDGDFHWTCAKGSATSR